MIYYDALLDITAGVDDPDGDRLFERAKDHLIRAISRLMAEGNWREDDLPGYWKIKNDISFASTDTENQFYEDLDGLDSMRIVDLFPRPWATTTDEIYEQVVRYVSIDHIARVVQSSRYRPDDNEVYIWRNGLRLYIHISTGNALSVPLAMDNRLVMRYLKYPDNSGWDDSATAGAGGTELVGSLFSKPFIDQAINQAITTLLAEDTQ